MTITGKKLIPLEDAIKTYVKDGTHLSIGGFTINRNPMAAVYEIIRQGIKKLHVYAHSNGQGVDELIGGGCIERLEIAYGGSGRFAPTCIRFKKAVQNGSLQVEDYSNYQMSLRFLAGAMGLPYLPTRSSLGTDIIQKWGFPPSFRQSREKIPDKKLVVEKNPFNGWGDAEQLVLVPAITPEVTIIHAQNASPEGIVRIEGLLFSDIEQVKASKHVIVTCEQLMEDAQIRKMPDLNQLPSFCVDAVVHVPYGAYPTACYHYYDYDPVYLKNYKKAAEDNARFAQYLKELKKMPDHEALLKRCGRQQLAAIAADKKTGYATGLDRR